MLKIKGNKEFAQWWDHWMSRIHPNQDTANDGHPRMTPNDKTRPRRQVEAESQRPAHRERPRWAPTE